MAELHKYDTGASIVAKITESSASLDVSSASSIRFYYQKPDGTTTGSWSGSARSGSADELIYVTSSSSDLDVAGIWKLQPWFALNPWEGSAEAEPFEVLDTLRS